MARPVTTKSLVSLFGTAVLLSIFTMTACGDDGDDDGGDSSTGGTASGGTASGGTTTGGTATGGAAGGQGLMNLRKNTAPSAR